MSVLHDNEFNYFVSKLATWLNLKANKVDTYRKDEVYTMDEVDTKVTAVNNNINYVKTQYESVLKNL